MPRSFLPPSATRDARTVLIGRALRAFGDGYVAVLLPLHLEQLGHGPAVIGAVATATLVGSAALTLLVGARSHKLRRRETLLAAAVLMAATGIGFAFAHDLFFLFAVAVVGTLNPSIGDVSLFLPLEQTVLAQSVAPAERTALFVRFSLVGAVVAAAGAFAAGLVDPLGTLIGRGEAIRLFFFLYAAAGVAVFLLYRTLSPAVEHATAVPLAPLGPSRSRVYGIAALFAVDAFGGGFVGHALLALWLYENFGVSAGFTGTLFSIMQLCAAASFPAAEWISRRIGLVRTMVWTHVPSSFMLFFAAFAPDMWWAAAFLILRAACSQMDQPTRTSYVMAIVTPPERPAAASFTAVPRSLASCISPAIAGAMFAATPFGWPLIVGGVIKLSYDAGLLRMFSTVRPPEEEHRG